MTKKKSTQPETAKWIWYHGQASLGYDLINSWMQARRVFTLGRVPRQAILQVTADTLYKLYVNGAYVLRGPARGFQESWPYDEIDISAHLRKGKNVVCALVQNFGISTFQYIHESAAGFWLSGKTGSEDLSTGPAWKARSAPPHLRVHTRLSVQKAFQEFYDARLDEESWLLPEYDDSSWRAPFSRSSGSAPWHKMEERKVPLLEERPGPPVKVVSEAKARCDDGYLSSKDVVSLYCAEKKTWVPSSLGCKISGEWGFLEVPQTGYSNLAAYCIDFGKEVVGSIRILVEGGTGDEVVDTLITEGLEGLEPAIKNPLEHGRQAFGNRIFCKKGTSAFEQFDYWGFRYLVLVVRNSSRNLKIGVGLRHVRYPLEITGSFDSSNSKLNKIYEISTRAQECCMFDAYVDCPWREQAQWWGDARVQALNTFYLSADARLLRRGIEQIGMQDPGNGLTYGHTPTPAHNCILPDFTLVWIMTFWDYYWQTGDLSLFREQSGRIERALNYFAEKTAANGLIGYDERYWLFLDWSPIFKEGYPTLYNLLYVLALEYAVRLFNLVGNRGAAKHYSASKQKLVAAIEKKLFNARNGSIYGGLDWKNKPVAQDSVHNYALSILIGLFPKYHQEFCDRVILPLVRSNDVLDAEKRKQQPLPSPFFSFYVLEALKKAGKTEPVVDCIYRWWGNMVDRGLTTTEERWNCNAGRDSLCHAWSAHPIVHLSNVLLGVWQESVGWKKIKFDPTFAGHVDSVKGKVATPFGPVAVEWVRKKDRIQGVLSLPSGVTAVSPLFEKKRVLKGKLSFEVDPSCKAERN